MGPIRLPRIAPLPHPSRPAFSTNPFLISRGRRAHPAPARAIAAYAQIFLAKPAVHHFYILHFTFLLMPSNACNNPTGVWLNVTVLIICETLNFSISRSYLLFQSHTQPLTHNPLQLPPVYPFLIPVFHHSKPTRTILCNICSAFLPVPGKILSLVSLQAPITNRSSTSPPTESSHTSSPHNSSPPRSWRPFFAPRAPPSFPPTPQLPHAPSRPHPSSC